MISVLLSTASAKQILWSQAGGYCGWGDSPEMPEYRCVNGLHCVKPMETIPGDSYGHCNFNGPPPHSGVGGRCGNGDDGELYCEPWLTCVGGDGAWYGACEDTNQHHKMMGRRRAEAASPSPSGVGGPCGGEMSWDNPSPVYYCEPWLTCVGADGTVEGTCEDNSQHTSGVNGRCGNGQDGYFSCEPSLTCVGGDGAWYGACVVPKHYSDLGDQCGNGRDGYKTCQPWLTCIGGDGAWYGVCEDNNQHHKSMGRRRVEDSNELVAPSR